MTDPITPERLRALVAVREEGIRRETLDEWVNDATEAMQAAAVVIERLRSTTAFAWNAPRLRGLLGDFSAATPPKEG